MSNTVYVGASIFAVKYSLIEDKIPHLSIEEFEVVDLTERFIFVENSAGIERKFLLRQLDKAINKEEPLKLYDVNMYTFSSFLEAEKFLGFFWSKRKETLIENLKTCKESLEKIELPTKYFIKEFKVLPTKTVNKFISAMDCLERYIEGGSLLYLDQKLTNVEGYIQIYYDTTIRSSSFNLSLVTLSQPRSQGEESDSFGLVTAEITDFEPFKNMSDASINLTIHKSLELNDSVSLRTYYFKYIPIKSVNKNNLLALISTYKEHMFNSVYKGVLRLEEILSHMDEDFSCSNVEYKLIQQD